MNPEIELGTSERAKDHYILRLEAKARGQTAEIEGLTESRKHMIADVTALKRDLANARQELKDWQAIRQMKTPLAPEIPQIHAPPAISRNDGMCVICECRPAESNHHLFPASIRKARQLSPGRFGAKAAVCHNCHRAIHKRFSNSELFDTYNTVLSLRAQLADVIRCFQKRVAAYGSTH